MVGDGRRRTTLPEGIREGSDIKDAVHARECTVCCQRPQRLGEGKIEHTQAVRDIKSS